jgi:hypothetical protein
VVGIWHGQATRDDRRQPIEIVGIDLAAAGTPAELDREGNVLAPAKPGLAALLETLKVSFGPALYAFLKENPALGTIDFSNWEDV